MKYLNYNEKSLITTRFASSNEKFIKGALSSSLQATTTCMREIVLLTNELGQIHQIHA